MSAYLRAQAAATSGARMRVFDWIKAAQLIKERNPEEVYAGLGEDWENTSGVIYRSGHPTPLSGCAYLSSIWATPKIDIDCDIIDCWRYEDETGWNARTHWPEEAKAILAETGNN